MKLKWKLVVPLLAALAACGRPGSSEPAVLQCSVPLEANADAEAIQGVLDDVAAGRLDPCGGALADRELYDVDFARLDRGDEQDPYLLIVFNLRLRHPDQEPPARP